METNRKDEKLLQNIKKSMSKLEKLLGEMSGEWTYEDMMYRFYHQSFKVYRVQEMTKEIVETLMQLAPEGCNMDRRFKEIFDQGASGVEFDLSHNKEWNSRTRPMMEAFLHVKYFLEMAVKYGKSMEHAADMMPSGWAGILYLYGLR